MRHLLFSTLLLVAGFRVLAQQGNENIAKISPLTNIYLHEASKVKDGLVPGYVYKVFNGRNYISALIKVSAGFNDEALKSKGVLIGTKAGDIWTAQVPVEEVVAFTRIPGIAYIQLDEPIVQTLDSARKVTHVDSVHAGIGLSAPFYGKGVVVGIVDAGFDYTSPMLWDTGGSYYRVKRIWAQKAASGIPPTGYIYGQELKDSSSMITTATDQSNVSHGAHVAGIAAGSGYIGGDNVRFRGMAPLSDLVLVGIMPQQQQWINTGGTDVIDGTNYVYQYAASVGKPAVVNLSWGCSNGPHDGTSLFSQALNNLTGPGKIFVTSAGNSGVTKVHLKKTFTAADSVLHTFPTYDLAKRKTWVDMWGDAGKTYCVKVTLYNSGFAEGTTGYVCMDGLVHQFAITDFYGDTCHVSIVATASEFNGKPRVFVNLHNTSSDEVCVSVKGSSGTINMWNNYVEAPTGYIKPFTNGGQSWATEGDTLQSISDNASGQSAITVGAFSSKMAWTTVGGANNGYAQGSLGDIAPFSSVGPSSDGRIKPDIAGPGYGVASAVNSYDPAYAVGSSGYGASVVYSHLFPVTGRNYRYAVFAGTSMSSPAVAGIIALMLEANPLMSPQQVRNILNQTAIHDNYTGAGVNNTWGGGKVNAYQALKRSLQSSGIGGVAQNSLSCHVFPNPARDAFNIGYLGELSEQLQVMVYDLQGRTIYADNWSVVPGYNSRIVPMQTFAKGTYIVKAVSRTGASSAMRIVID